MTDEGLRLRRHDISLFVAEACGVLTRHAAAHGKEGTKSMYELDDWMWGGVEQGVMPAEAALNVLEKTNRADQEARN